VSQEIEASPIATTLLGRQRRARPRDAESKTGGSCDAPGSDVKCKTGGSCDALGGELKCEEVVAGVSALTFAGLPAVAGPTQQDAHGKRTWGYSGDRWHPNAPAWQPEQESAAWQQWAGESLLQPACKPWARLSEDESGYSDEQDDDSKDGERQLQPQQEEPAGTGATGGSSEGSLEEQLAVALAKLAELQALEDDIDQKARLGSTSAAANAQAEANCNAMVAAAETMMAEVRKKALKASG